MPPITIIILVLAVIQGLCEFLPVSSSGHLVVANALLEVTGGQPLARLLEVNVVLHLGTLASIIVFYRKRIWRLLSSDRRVVPLIIVGTIPAVIIGLPLKKLAPQLLENPTVAGLMFPVTAALLIWGDRWKTGNSDYDQLSYGQALLIGVAQAVAILPGISRSGSTIVAGVAVGMRRSSATVFAFLLAIPTIACAGILEAVDMVREGGSGSPSAELLAGFVVSMMVGFGALWWLVRWVERGRLHWFAYWLLPMGVAVTAWRLWP